METAPFHGDLASGPDGGRAWWLHTSDGVRIRLTVWPGDRHVLILTGRGEYAEKYGRVAADLAKAGYGAVTLDWRGQGLSDRLTPDPLAGHVDSFFSFQKDLEAVFEALPSLHVAPEVMLAHSMGGAIALRALHTGLPMRAVCFSAPMWGIQISRRSVPVAWGLSTLAARLERLSRRYIPGRGPQGRLTPMLFPDNPLTSDRKSFEWMMSQLEMNPELGLGGATLGWLNAALREMAALRRLPPPDIPAYIGFGSDESIVSIPAIRHCAARWPRAVLEEYPDARHEILMEAPPLRQRFIAQMVAHFDKVTERIS